MDTHGGWRAAIIKVFRIRSVYSGRQSNRTRSTRSISKQSIGLAIALPRIVSKLAICVRAVLYDNCSLEAKKMIVAQFVKAVRVKRGYELDIEFNVSFEEFQALYLEPEEKGRKRKRAGEILALAECAG